MYKSTLQSIQAIYKNEDYSKCSTNQQEWFKQLEQFARDEVERKRIMNLSPEELVQEITPMYDRIIKIYAKSGLTHLMYNSIYNIYDVYNKKGIIEPCIADREKICQLMMRRFDGCKIYFERFYDNDSILCEWSFHIDWE